VTVQLDPGRDWCPRHLKPYKALWPAGIGAATVALFDAAAQHPNILHACGYDEAAGIEADAKMLPAALVEHGPLCCLIDDATLALIHATTVPDPDPGRVTHISKQELSHEEMTIAVAFARPLETRCGVTTVPLPGAPSVGVCADCERRLDPDGPEPAHFHAPPPYTRRGDDG
jgi:hypothetical protein